MIAGLPDKQLTTQKLCRLSVNTISALLYLLLGTQLFGSVAIASQDDGVPIRSPEQVEGALRVDAEGLIALVSTKPGLTLIDSRLTTNRSFGYIEGSIGLPDSDTRCDTLAAIAPGKTQPLLFYCNGPKCGRSAVAVEVARECGYSNLYWFRGGIEEWREKGYPLLN